MCKVAVVGGTGFINRELVYEALKQQEKVIVMDLEADASVVNTSDHSGIVSLVTDTYEYSDTYMKKIAGAFEIWEDLDLTNDHTLKVDRNHKTKGKHAQPYYRNGRW